MPIPTHPRYGIYYAPEKGARLDCFGTALLGYDARSGEEVPFPDAVTATMTDWQQITAAARIYGFHATLKAPFTLAPGHTEAGLEAACAAFAASRRSPPVITPMVHSIDRFVAILPAHPTPELQQLAFDCVTSFDRFRAALTRQDRAKRQPHQLTPRQRGHLERWGYPYVAEDYRFHMTLTGRLETARLESMLKMLRARFATIAVPTLTINRICLFRQRSPQDRFRIIAERAW